MRKRFRRRPKVVWLPVIGYSQAGAEAAENSPYEYFGDGRYTRLALSAAGAGPTAGKAEITTEVVTFDDTFRPTQLEYDPEYSGASLNDMVKGSEYRLRRCVGRVYCSYTPNAAGEQPILPAVEVSVGLMVRDFGEIGSASAISEEVHPLAGLATEDPWVWKKHWLLGLRASSETPWGSTPGQPAVTAYLQWPFPSTNADYGSIIDGPQLDQKTARTVKRDQRLVMHFAARPIQVGQAGSSEPAGSAGGIVNFWWNMRILASLRGSAYGNRGNASR